MFNINDTTQLHAQKLISCPINSNSAYQYQWENEVLKVVTGFQIKTRENNDIII